MIKITKKYVDYVCSESNRRTTHFILIFEDKKHSVLLSHVNLFLYSTTRSSRKTSSRYASVISMFYRYLSTTDDFNRIHPNQYHLFSRNRHVKRWQTDRETKRVAQGAASPSTATIFGEAKLLMNYFRWLGDAGFNPGIEVQLKTWCPPYKSSRYQAYIALKAKKAIDTTSIEVLDKESRQSALRSLITPYEIRLLTENYSDPVYSAMLIFALSTAMRPMDLCRFPYFGNGDNAHIAPFSAMDFSEPTVNYTVHNSKRRKTRTILIHQDALETVEETYIKPLYVARAKKYEENYGEKPPLSLLFLTKDGHPVTPDRIAQRTSAAKKRALELNPNLRANLKFYDSRDWWPTQYMIRSFGEEILSANDGLYNLAVAEVLQNQMGHKFIQTTFNHYMDMARIILSIHKGRSTEILRAAEYSSNQFIAAVGALDERVAAMVAPIRD
ncbi:site-specific integrase [Pseudomonas chlororaphis]|uniref:site-specific integrase n=1 Tax=Pseudomonas chlororaphis TaxID=587753 RepID=UPI002D79F22F|nr:site-specific integrase [Pseudomonas chlororaphis]